MSEIIFFGFQFPTFAFKTKSTASLVLICSKTIFNSEKSSTRGVNTLSMNIFYLSKTLTSISLTSPCNSKGNPFFIIASKTE